MALPTLLAVAAQVSETAGESVSRTLFGVAQLIAASAANVRANKDAALTLSRRVNELVTVITLELERTQPGTSALDWQTKIDLQGFEKILVEIQSTLEEQGRRTYLSQVLHQDRDKERVNALAERIRQAFDILKLQIQLSMNELSRNMTTPLEMSAALQQLDDEHRALSSESKAPAQLPSQPQQFFGRANETRTIVVAITEEPAGHVVVLGGPGLGKTALALSAAHQHEVVARFGSRRYFVSCDGSEGQPSCLTIVGAALGIGGSNAKTIRKKLKTLLTSGPSLVVLDNFESVWEETTNRAAAEEVLHFLSSLDGVSVLVTLRGSERPQGVSWNRPFLPPLAPLDDNAAIQAFMSISGADDIDAHGKALLRHVENVPLCIVLMASLAQSESPRVLLELWDQQKTAILRRSDGSRRQTCLDVSISLSLRSPRMLAVPDSVSLLALLSLLPRGMIDTDMRIWATDYTPRILPTLLQTALAFRTDEQRIQVLAPIRTYMLARHPPSEDLARPLYDYFYGLADALVSSGRPVTRAKTIAALAPELENAGFLIRHAIENCSDPSPAISAAVSLCKLYSTTNYGPGPELAAPALSKARQLGLEELTAHLLLWWGSMSYNAAVPGEPIDLYREALSIYERIGNIDGTIDAATNLSPFNSPQAAVEKVKELRKLAESRGDPWRSAKCSQKVAEAYTRLGKHSEARIWHEQAIETMRPLEQEPAAHRVIGYGLYQIAGCLFDLGDFVEGIKKCREALPLLQSAENTFGVCVVYFQLGDALLDQGHWTEAIEHCQLAVHNGAADFRFNAACFARLARAHLMGGNVTGAQAAIDTVAPLIDKDDPYRYSTVLRARAALALFRGDANEARGLLDAATALARQHDGEIDREDLLPYEAANLQLRGEVEASEGRCASARNCFVTCAIVKRMFDFSDIVVPLCSLAEVVDDATATALIGALMLPLQRFQWKLRSGNLLLHSARIARRQGDTQIAARRASAALGCFVETKNRDGQDRVHLFSYAVRENIGLKRRHCTDISPRWITRRSEN